MPPSLTQVVGKRVYELRRKRDLDQAELSAAVNARGLDLTQSVVSRIERGERALDTTELFVIAGALDVSPLALLDPGDEFVQIGNDELRGPVLRNLVRGFSPVAGTDARGFYDGMPTAEWEAFRVPKVQHLVLWVVERLLDALGRRAWATEELRVLAESDPEGVAEAVAKGETAAARETEHAVRLLDDIKRFADTIQSEITEES